MTSISMSPAVCAFRKRRPISPPPPRWFLRLPDAPLPADAVYFGEVSLSGAIRPVAHASVRLKEAAKLGFVRAVMPESSRGEGAEQSLATSEIGNLAALVAGIAANGRRPAPNKSGGQDG